MIPASKTYGVFTMRKKQILISCIVLVVILTIIAIYVLSGKKDSVRDEFSSPHTIESETDKEMEDETPLEVVDPEEDKKSDIDSVDDNSNSDSQTGNQQGANKDTDAKDIETKKEEEEKEEEEKEEEEKEEEDKSESKPIELPFIPVD